MTKTKGKLIKHPALWAGILIAVLLAAEAGAVFIFDNAKDAAFLDWIQNISEDSIAQARAFKHRESNESDQIVINLTESEDKQNLVSLLNNIQEINVYEAPTAEGVSYVLDMTETSVPSSSSGSHGEILINVVSDGKLYLTFDSETGKKFGSKGKTWWIDYPELASYISNLITRREAQVNVIAAMSHIKASDFSNPEELGNVSAKKLAAALRHAAKEDKLLALSDEEAFGETDTKWFWEIIPAIEGDPETGIRGNDMHFRIRCGLAENIVEISFGQAGAYDTIKLEDEALYDLVRSSNDYKIVVKKGAYNKYKHLLVPQMEKALESTTADLGTFSGYKVTRFVKVWDYNDNDGSTVKLYDFKYALLPEEPEKIVLTGGMYLDSKMRLHGVEAGQFAVREKNGEIISGAFMGNDFYYSPDAESEVFTQSIEERKAAKSRISSALALAEKTA